MPAVGLAGNRRSSDQRNASSFDRLVGHQVETTRCAIAPFAFQQSFVGGALLPVRRLACRREIRQFLSFQAAELARNLRVSYRMPFGTAAGLCRRGNPQTVCAEGAHFAAEGGPKGEKNSWFGVPVGFSDLEESADRRATDRGNCRRSTSSGPASASRRRLIDRGSAPAPA